MLEICAIGPRRNFYVSPSNQVHHILLTKQAGSMVSKQKLFPFGRRTMRLNIRNVIQCVAGSIDIGYSRHNVVL